MVQAEGDYSGCVSQSLVCYTALAKACVGGNASGVHAFVLGHTKFPITDWPRLVEAWLQKIGIAYH